jgi:spermidine synthase
MSLEDPYALVLDYTHNMMAGLLLKPEPRSFLQLGLGAASLTKACYKLFPRARITAVDNSEAVIAYTHEHFKCPRPNRRLNIECADAQTYLRSTDQGFDMMHVDLYDAAAAGPVYGSLGFYRLCAKRLAPGGVFAVNLFGHRAQFGQQLSRLVQAFDGPILPLKATPAGNVVVLATHLDPPIASLRDLRLRAQALREAHGWDTRAWPEALT